MTTIAITKSGWRAKMYFAGKAKDWIVDTQKEHKKGATSAGTEITQEKDFLKTI